ncbi:TetR/AcrR family transcriptional regulator [Hoeflea prorocentri]|uniref:TetR/AcrR family transcriptional regulator n=1 Tax=Hoeflea prorocentri TaxID=1922333 RepID=A0A9X3ZHB3_9HYPH|nr:TetR/AcrR family transcriptional regulator [Hoeflea prorocentri]MCY6380716.1 TetR/AcrR family transcriptional regulator [Hoeflea prorocentri]MDA5398516.1 TetR/AcrR family transcriptional regulator [Hoeflea prorocentri]
MNDDVRRKPRQKRSREKVDKILDAVETLVTQQSLEALTTTQVAEHTGYAVGTIYQYFGNRTELLIAAEERLFERLAQHLAKEVFAVLSDPVDNAIEKLIGIYIDSAKAQPGYLQLLKFSSVNKPPGINEATVDEFTGDLIAAIIRSEAPDIGDGDLEVARKTAVGIMAPLTDRILLEKNPVIQTKLQAEMVALCESIIMRAIEAGKQ